VDARPGCKVWGGGLGVCGVGCRGLSVRCTLLVRVNFHVNFLSVRSLGCEHV